MKLLNESVIEFSDKRDDLRTIELDFEGPISSEYQASQVLTKLDYDYGDITTAENIVIVFNGYKDRFYTNGFDLLCYLKCHNKLRY